MTVITFEEYRPVPRYDGLPWTSLRIEESLLEAGPWTEIDTQPLSPADSDPANPQERNFTTEEATLDEGWYRVTFLDATGDESITGPVFYPAVPDDPRRPSVDDVAKLLRTRTVAGLATGLGADSGPADQTTFDATTRPSRNEVQNLIGTSYDAMLGRLAVPLEEGSYDTFRHIVALYTAVLIEVSYFREQNQQNDALLRLWRETIAELLAAIQTKWERDHPGSVVDPDQRVYGWGMLVVASSTEPSAIPPEPDRMEGIDF